MARILPPSLSPFVPLVARAARAALVLVAWGAAACAPAVVPANGTGPSAAIDEQCPIEPDALAVFEEGDIPLVLTSTHAGETTPLGCNAGDDVLRAIDERVCDPARDDACQSGPCRAGTGDVGLRLLTFALVEELEKCLGGRPSLALTEVRRTLVDMNRDARDTGGATCALEDEAALPYWEAYHRGVEGLVARASAQAEKAGKRALLVDLHTYQTLKAAPPPSLMIGSGVPFGTTLPQLAADDPAFDLVFADKTGLRARLLENLAGIAKGELAVLPAAGDADLTGLFSGRYMVHRYARVVPNESSEAGPAVDALQIEVSGGLRDESLATASAIARALCGAFGERIGAAPARGGRT